MIGDSGWTVFQLLAIGLGGLLGAYGRRAHAAFWRVFFVALFFSCFGRRNYHDDKMVANGRGWCPASALSGCTPGV